MQTGIRAGSSLNSAALAWYILNYFLPKVLIEYYGFQQLIKIQHILDLSDWMAGARRPGAAATPPLQKA
jgi:hypothetical protein